MEKKRKIGERYNPHRVFTGIFIPEAILKIPVKKLSFGARICFGRLCRYAGKDGVAFPKRNTLAKEIGSSERAVDRFISELKEFGLIKVERKGLHKSNRYYFVWHNIFDESDESDASLDLPKVATQNLSKVATPIERESDESESDERESIYHSKTSFAGDDDVSLFFDSEEKTDSLSEIKGKTVNEIIKMFEPLDISFDMFYKNKTQRQAVERILKRVGEENLRGIMIFLRNVKECLDNDSSIDSLCYVPDIKTPIQLEQKYQSLIESQKRINQELENNDYSSLEDMFKKEIN
jgi:hypothetical protein